MFMSTGSLNPTSEVPTSKGVLCSPHAHIQTHSKVNTEDALSGFQDYFPQPIIKIDRNLKKIIFWERIVLVNGHVSFEYLNMNTTAQVLKYSRHLPTPSKQIRPCSLYRFFRKGNKQTRWGRKRKFKGKLEGENNVTHVHV